MAAVSGQMDDSYAGRAKKATIGTSARNNIKSQVAHGIQDVPAAHSSSTSDTLDSSPALSTSQTAATSLALPTSVPLSSASSDQASPTQPSISLPLRNAWSDRGPWKTPTKPVATSISVTPRSTLEKSQPTLNMSPLAPRSELNPPPLKAATKSSQKNPDPFVVNYNLPQPKNILTDSQNWPTVGDTAASQHRPQPSLSSTASTTVLPASQISPKPAGDNGEVELTPSKKAKGEKMKWTPVPPKELQAATNQEAARHHEGSSSKSHSPRTNGSSRRLNEETSDGRPTGKLPSRDGSSPTWTGSTRHDRNPSLTVPSAGSSRRVSPLHMTSSLPSPSSNLTLDQPFNQGSPPRPSLPSPSTNAGPASRNDASPQNDPRDAPSSNPAPMAPSTHSDRFFVHSQNESQTVYPAVPTIGYNPAWPAPGYGMPYYPPYQPYPPTRPISQTEVYHSPRIRQRRKCRTAPQDAPAVAGYRTMVPEVLHWDHESRVTFIVEEDVAHEQVGTPDSQPLQRIRDPWWAYGISKKKVERWFKRHPEILPAKSTGAELSQGPTLAFEAESNGPPAATGGSPIESAILQNTGYNSQHGPQSEPVTSYPTWPTPGAGPSNLDIGMAMGMPIPAPHIPPPLYMGVPFPPPPHLPSPGSAVSRPEWPNRDDLYANLPQPTLMYQYVPYPYQPMNGHQSPSYRNDNVTMRSSYANEGTGRGGGRGWRDERYTSRGGGRGRGYPSRGRGMRGNWSGSRPFTTQHGSSNGAPPNPYSALPSQHPLNTTTVYIPEAILPHPVYSPYSPVAPQQIASYNPPAQNTDQGGNSQGRPPSPKPMTTLPFQLDHLRFKLLGQIEYYFSHENVAKDPYLRGQMDSKGWVSLQVVQSFRRIQQMNVSDDMIRETLRLSQHVEVRQHYMRMARDEWRHYVGSNAPESTVSDIPEPTFAPPPVFYGYPPPTVPMYPPPNPYAYYPPPPPNPYVLSNGIEDHILKRPEERLQNGNVAVESGTSVGESFDSTPHTTEAEDAETSEDDVVFLIGEPSPMTRPTNSQVSVETIGQK